MLAMRTSGYSLSMATAVERFEPFSTEHQLALGLFLVGAVVVVVLGRRWRGRPEVGRGCRVAAVVIVLIGVTMQLLQFTPDEWDRQTSLPLHLCDIGWVVAAVALWTRRRLLTTIAFLWGVVLTTQAMITPDLAAPFPEPRFLMFWAMHWMVVWAGLFLVLGLGIRPGWRDYGWTVAITIVWAVLTVTANIILDTNYGYLNAKPAGGSFLDLLGPWPYYVFVEAAIIASVWALMVWPLQRDPDPVP